MLKYLTINDILNDDKYAIVDGPTGAYINKKDYIDDPNGIQFISTKNIDGVFSPKPSKYISKDKFESIPRGKVVPNDIIMAKSGSCGKCCLYPEGLPPAIISSNLLKITCSEEIIPLYLFLVLKSSSFQNQLKSIISYTSMPTFNLKKFKMMKIPLVDIHEQKEFIKKHTELLDVTDKFKSDSDIILKQFGRLWCSMQNRIFYKETISENKMECNFMEKIAVRRDELRKIEYDQSVEKLKGSPTRKEGLKEWQDRNRNTILIEREKLPKLSKGWEWTSLGEICTRITNGPEQNPEYIENGIPFISIGNINDNGDINFSDAKFISEESYEYISYKCAPKIGDIIMSKQGNVGRISIINTNKKFTVNANLALIRPVSELVDVKFIAFFLKFGFESGLFNPLIGGSSLRFISVGNLTGLPIPISSIEAQKEVADKIDNLNVDLRAASKSISKAQGMASKLTDSFVYHQLYRE